MMRRFSSRRKSKATVTPGLGVPAEASERPAATHDDDIVRVPSALHFTRASSAPEPLVGEPKVGAQRLLNHVPQLSLENHIDVYALPAGLETDVLWASDRLPRYGAEHYPFAETQLVTIEPSIDVISGALRGKAPVTVPTTTDAARDPATDPATDPVTDPSTDPVIDPAASPTSVAQSTHGLASDLVLQGDDVRISYSWPSTVAAPLLDTGT
jgi:hypothetical protein